MLKTPMRGWKSTFDLAKATEMADGKLEIASQQKRKLVVLTELTIPAESQVHVPRGFSEEFNKLRAERAIVESNTSIEGKSIVHAASWYGCYRSNPESWFDRDSIKANCQDQYVTGQSFEPDKFSQASEVCDSGVHFFLKRQQAESYIY